MPSSTISDGVTSDPLDRITDRISPPWTDEYGRELHQEWVVLRRQEVLALVEIARAARALIADREGANIGEERLALRDALARLDGKNSGGDPVVVHPADSLAESQSEVSDLPDGLHGYTPEEAFEVRVKHATAKLCDFDPDAAAYYQRTEAWVRLVLAADDQREAELNPQYEARGGDPDYSPDYQDEYQRLWHEAAGRADAAEAREARLRDGLREHAKHELGEKFGADAGDCWCDPFYRGEKWPGHDELCTRIRALLAEDGAA